MFGKMKQRRAIHGKFKGQSIMELTLFLPFLLVIIIGAVEFGRLFFTQIIITNAAREGAYYLSTHISDYNAGTGNAPNTTLAVELEALNSGVSEVTVTVTSINCCTAGEYSVEVTVGTNVNDLLVLGFLGNVFSLTSTNYDEFPLSASVEMLVQ